MNTEITSLAISVFFSSHCDTSELFLFRHKAPDIRYHCEGRMTELVITFLDYRPINGVISIPILDKKYSNAILNPISAVAKTQYFTILNVTSKIIIFFEQ
jgi:hypothetical protein